MYYFSQLVALFLPVLRGEGLLWTTNDFQCSAINNKAKSRKLSVRGRHLFWIKSSVLLPRSVNQAYNYNQEYRNAYNILCGTNYGISFNVEQSPFLRGSNHGLPLVSLR
jgi:hypothetical protein